MTESLDPDAKAFEEVVARIEIYEALMRYCRGIDRARPELVRSAFHDDAVNDRGPLRESAPEASALRSAADKRAHLPRVGQHMITNHTIAFLSDARANCESSWFAVIPGPAGYGMAGGRYLDRFERREGHWRIAHRMVVCDWSRGVEDFPVLLKTQSLPKGSLGEDDPAYGFLEEAAEIPT